MMKSLKEDKLEIVTVVDRECDVEYMHCYQSLLHTSLYSNC